MMKLIQIVGAIVLFLGALGIVIKRIRGGVGKKQKPVQISRTEVKADAGTGKHHLKEKLLQTEKTLWDIKKLNSYGKLFEGIVKPLQTLMGLADISLDTLAKDKIDYYMWSVITDQFMIAIRNADGRIMNGRLILPDSDGTFEEEKIRDSIADMSVQEIERSIQENEMRINAGKITIQKAQTVMELGGIAEELQSFDRKEPVKEKNVRRLAREVQLIMEKNEIYPMWARDERLGPELKKTFIPLNRYAIKYPGIFIKWGEEWEVLGAYLGMDDCEV